MAANPTIVIGPIRLAAQVVRFSNTYEMGNCLKPATNPFNCFLVLGRRYQHLCLGVVQYVGPLMRGQSIVQRHRDNPGLGACKIDERVFDAILGENSDPVSLLESGAGKGIGQAVDLLACLAVGDRPVSHSGERGFGVFADMEI